MESTAQPATGASPARELLWSLDDLPEDALLQVLKYLHVEDLLACRLVSRRLGDLALHPAVWRHVRLQAPSCPVMRLAPCLAILTVDNDETPCKHLHSTDCAVRQLNIECRDGVEASEMFQLMKRQEALGRLRRLDLEFDYEINKPYEPFILLKAPASISGLEFLNVTVGSVYANEYPFQQCTVPSSLKEFWCTGEAGLGDFVCCVLATHAATLEKISIEAPMWSPQTARSLGGVRNLHHLTCKLLPGMEALAECGSLRILFLSDSQWPSDRVQGVVQLLRRAHRLVDVSLRNGIEARSPGTIHAFAEMIKALGWSGESCVVKLCIKVGVFYRRTDESDCYLPMRVALLNALPRLPALRKLTLDWESDEILPGITPETAPSLRSLDLALSSCAQAWMLNTATRRLLSLNPSLHVQASHDLTGTIAWLFSHPQDQCPSEEYHAPKEGWMQVPIDESLV
ncbi:uncharacterized protein LOC127750277 isoform X5 [Frankliniella occidentalis]|uniref:Uncharacterized protein LOC127750277 isoform X5 n=1 Tax=Frankliniella occidentalis TaxID=133901 RepID=A0A9C6X1L4_FRAOC|nr:uncharacterized protein LOC127750277 isoform X5 [Frankliniella occidentalis]